MQFNASNTPWRNGLDSRSKSSLGVIGPTPASSEDSSEVIEVRPIEMIRNRFKMGVKEVHNVEFLKNYPQASVTKILWKQILLRARVNFRGFHTVSSCFLNVLFRFGLLYIPQCGNDRNLLISHSFDKYFVKASEELMISRNICQMSVKWVNFRNFHTVVCRVCRKITWIE